MLLGQLFAYGLNFHIKELSAEAWIEETISFDIQSSVVINSGSSIPEGFPLQRLKTGLYFDIIADLIEQVGKRVTDVIVSYVRIATFWTMKSMSYIKNFSTCAIYIKMISFQWKCV